MADTYGPITLPIDPPENQDESVSDPLLDISLEFFQAFINFYGGAAWRKVAPSNNSKPVANIFASDPEDVIFNEKDLPALYMWRVGSGGNGDGGSTGTDWLSEDIRLIRDQLMLFWVFPPARQRFRGFREQFEAGAAKMLHVAIEMGQDPCWVKDGDPDPLRHTYGSVFPRLAGWQSMVMSKWQDRAMKVDMGNGQTRTYPAMLTTIEVAEQYTFDITKRAAVKGVNIQIRVPGDPASINTPLLVDERLIINP